MPIYMTVLMTILVSLGVVLAYVAVMRIKKERRRRARWLAGEDR